MHIDGHQYAALLKTHARAASLYLPFHSSDPRATPPHFAHETFKDMTYGRALFANNCKEIMTFRSALIQYGPFFTRQSSRCPSRSVRCKSAIILIISNHRPSTDFTASVQDMHTSKRRWSAPALVVTKEVSRQGNFDKRISTSITSLS